MGPLYACRWVNLIDNCFSSFFLSFFFFFLVSINKYSLHSRDYWSSFDRNQSVDRCWAATILTVYKWRTKPVECNYGGISSHARGLHVLKCTLTALERYVALRCMVPNEIHTILVICLYSQTGKRSRTESAARGGHTGKLVFIVFICLTLWLVAGWEDELPLGADGCKAALWPRSDRIHISATSMSAAR